jgi:hypothetical protein
VLKPDPQFLEHVKQHADVWLGLAQAGIPHKYPAKPKVAAAAKAEPDKAAGRADKEGGDAATAGKDASKQDAVPVPGVSDNIVNPAMSRCWSCKVAEDASTKL